MANGVLGKAMTQNGVNVPVYTAPGTIDFATITLNIVNMGTTEASVKVAVGTAASPGAVDYIEYDAKIPANGGILERSCMLVSPNEIVHVNGNSNNLACRVTGLEKL